jgi:hypothetical protein
MGAIPGALMIGVRVAKTTNAFLEQKRNERWGHEGRAGFQEWWFRDPAEDEKRSLVWPSQAVKPFFVPANGSASAGT